MTFQRIIPLGLKMTAAAGLLLMMTACGGGGAGVKQGAALDGPKEVVTTYRNNCISCHGTDLQGRVGANTNLKEIGARMDTKAITIQIEDGEGLMPAFKDKLTAEEIAGLAEWLANKK